MTHLTCLVDRRHEYDLDHDRRDRDHYRDLCDPELAPRVKRHLMAAAPAPLIFSWDNMIADCFIAVCAWLCQSEIKEIDGSRYGYYARDWHGTNALLQLRGVCQHWKAIVELVIAGELHNRAGLYAHLSTPRRFVAYHREEENHRRLNVFALRWVRSVKFSTFPSTKLLEPLYHWRQQHSTSGGGAASSTTVTRALEVMFPCGFRVHKYVDTISALTPIVSDSVHSLTLVIDDACEATDIDLSEPFLAATELCADDVDTGDDNDNDNDDDDGGGGDLDENQNSDDDDIDYAKRQARHIVLDDDVFAPMQRLTELRVVDCGGRLVLNSTHAKGEGVLPATLTLLDYIETPSYYDAFMALHPNFDRGLLYANAGRLTALRELRVRALTLSHIRAGIAASSSCWSTTLRRLEIRVDEHDFHSHLWKGTEFAALEALEELTCNPCAVNLYEFTQLPRLRKLTLNLSGHALQRLPVEGYRIGYLKRALAHPRFFDSLQKLKVWLYYTNEDAHHDLVDVMWTKALLCCSGGGGGGGTPISLNFRCSHTETQRYVLDMLHNRMPRPYARLRENSVVENTPHRGYGFPFIKCVVDRHGVIGTGDDGLSREATIAEFDLK